MTGQLLERKIKMLVLAGRDPRKRFRFVVEPGKEIPQLDVSIAKIDKAKPASVLSLFNALYKAPPDIIISIGAGMPGIIGWVCSKILSIPFVIRLGGDPLEEKEQAHQYNADLKRWPSRFRSQLLYKIDTLIFRKTVFYFVVSRYLKTCLKFHNTFKHREIFILPQFRRLEKDQNRFRDEISEKQAIRVLTISNFNYFDKYTGIEQLVSLLDEYCQSHSQKINFTVCGGGGYLERVKALEKKVGKSSFLTMSVLGYQADIRSFFLGSDIFLYCSNYDALPNVILEAYSYGLPVITNDSPIFEDLVFKNKTGGIFNAHDTGSFNRIFNRIITDSRFRKTLTENGRQLLEHRFSKKKIGDLLLENTIKVLNSGSSD